MKSLLSKTTLAVALFTISTLIASAQKPCVISTYELAGWEPKSNVTRLEFHLTGLHEGSTRCFERNGWLESEENVKDGKVYRRVVEKLTDFDAGFSKYINDQFAHLRISYYDHRMYVLDTRTGEETVGFDFTLSPGDICTTYNGMQWRVTAATDTIIVVPIPSAPLPEDLPEDVEIIEPEFDEWHVTTRHMRVESLDGTLHDEWIDGFGSVHYWQLLDNLPREATTHVLYFQAYDEAFTLKFDFNEGGLFGKNIGLAMAEDKQPFDERTEVEDGTLYIDRYFNLLNHHQYYLYGSVKDSNIHVRIQDLGIKMGWETESIPVHAAIPGFQAPPAGSFNISIPDALPVGIGTLTQSPTLNTPNIYNLQGQKVGEGYKGIVIKNRRKEVQK